MEAPPPLEGSSRRRGRARPSEWSLGDEFTQADLDLTAIVDPFRYGRQEGGLPHEVTEGNNVLSEFVPQ